MRSAAILVLGLLVLVAAPAASADLRAIPPDRTLVAVGQQDEEAMDDYVAATGREPAGLMWYLDAFYDLEETRAQIGRIEGHLRSHPRAVLQLGLSFGAISTPTISRAPLVPTGALDPQIDALAHWLKQLDTVTFLRIGYEFDLLGGQYGPPPVYKAAYRYVVDRLRARGVRDVAYVWHSAGAFWRMTDYSGPGGFVGTFDRSELTSGPLATYAAALGSVNADALPVTAFYPGRRYVDYFGISYWGDACCGGRSYPEARALYEQRTREILDQASAMGLPIMIGESTPVYVGADSGGPSVAWLRDMFDLVREYDIRALGLIVPDWREGGFFAAPFWNGYWPDARIHRFPDTRRTYLAEVSKRRYVHGCAGLIPWLRGRPGAPCPR